jgi:hypothetical protein
VNPALDRLKRRHGWTGGNYRGLVRTILEAGVSGTARAAGEVQHQVLTRSAKAAGASATGNLLVPSSAASLARSAVLRKAAQDGELLMDTLRERLQGRLRQALEDHYAKPGAKWERREGRGRLDPELVDSFEAAVHQAMDPYCRRHGLAAPANCRAIAETELRSADSMAKEAFAQAVAAANHTRWRIVKVWVHHPHLSRTEPREGHAMADGQSRGLGDPFSVPLVEKGTVRGHLSMAHPHDPAAPVGEVISCHCECDYRCLPVGYEYSVTPKTREEREAKWDSGVYKARRLAGRADFHGLPISLEHRKGGVREGTDSDGEPWRTKMLFPYGYIRGTEGADGDEVDCFLGDDRDSTAVFVVHTYRPGTMDYDEDKVMLGFTSAVEARRWLEAHYDRYVVQSVDETDVEGLKGLLEFCEGERLEVRKDTTGMVSVGGRIKKPDGSTWERTGPYSYKKVLNPDGSPYLSRSKGTNQGHGKASGSAQAPAGTPDAPPAQPEPRRAPPLPPVQPGMTADEAQAVLDRVGEKGLWNLTKEGLNNWLQGHGVNWTKLKFSEKHAEAKRIMKEKLERDKVEGTIAHPKIKPYDNKNIGWPAYFDPEAYERSVLPRAGGHWGSATSSNAVAKAVAASSGTKWRPIDKAVDGKLTLRGDRRQVLGLEVDQVLRGQPQVCEDHPRAGRHGG